MWWRPAKRIWCSECTGLGHTERRRTEARTRYSDGGGGREVVRDGNGRVRQIERRRRKRSRRQNMREDHRDDWRRGERERKMLVPLLDPRDTQ